MNPKAIGERTEGIVLGHLIRQGKVVSIPFGNNQRYDFILDEDGQLSRCQVKTGRMRNGAVQVNTHSVNGFTGEKKGYKGQADLFLVYCPENDKVYRVPVEAVGERGVLLRVDPPKKQHSAIIWASQYEI